MTTRPTAELASAAWFKSTYSAPNNDCVEVADLDGAVAVRDSKDPAAGALAFSPAAFAAFVRDVRGGRFDLH